jgi:hypothetical protein
VAAARKRTRDPNEPATPARKRTRGPNKRAKWVRDPALGVSVIRLTLDTHDPVQRRLVEAVFSATFEVRRALQHELRSKLRAYHTAHRERAVDRDALLARLGLSQTALEYSAYRHLEQAPHLRRFATKAVVMHVADNVWTSGERHLFPDAAGKRHGMPRVGKWYEFTRIPGRAKSHTEDRKWESFRLHGSLAGHRAAYTQRDRFVQPQRMRPVAAKRWWAHDGALAVVFTGLHGGELALPVRLPTEPSNQAHLEHHLADPDKWHKIDLVRTRDPNAEGGWRYEAHLMVLTQPYVSPSTRARREAVAIAHADRFAGIDVNVSNITVASHEDTADLVIDRIVEETPARRRRERKARRNRWRARHLDLSRRASNPAQYELSPRQVRQAEERQARGQPPRQVIPRGARKARSNGKPQQAYRRDNLTNTYRKLRATDAAVAAGTTQARRDAARHRARAIVQVHGFRFIVEDCDLRVWSRHWGRTMAAFTPGTFVTALEREASAIALQAGHRGGVVRAATATTALSQHCLCGARCTKTLADRIHRCSVCGLVGDRDAVAATLASVVVVDATSSAMLDLEHARKLLPAARATLRATVSNLGWQDIPSESTAHSACDRPWITDPGRTSSDYSVARQIVGTASRAIPNELTWATSVRAGMRTNTPRFSFAELRDVS